MSRKTIKDLRALIEGPASSQTVRGGHVSDVALMQNTKLKSGPSSGPKSTSLDSTSTTNSISKPNKKGSVLDRIKAKEKLGLHVKKQQEEIAKKAALDNRQILEVENCVRDILREKKASGEVLSRRKLCRLVEDSLLGLTESSAVAASVDKVLNSQ